MSKLLPFLAIVVAISPMPATLSAADLIVGGADTLTLTIDTQVAGDVIVRDSGILTINGVILEVDGDVWLEDTGRLVLQNQATLTLTLEFDEEHHVDISGNARLEVDNSLINSTGGQFWFELSDDSGGIPTLQVSGADSWLTNHSGIRPYDQARVIVTGGDVEELQARDQVIVTVDHAATYPVYFFDGVTANLQSLWTDTAFTIGNTVSDGN